jgi:hypothetical protein
MALVNLPSNSPLQVETRALELAISMIEKSVGMEKAQADSVTPNGVWNTCRALFVSVPVSDGIQNLSESEQDRQLEAYIGIDKKSFLQRAKSRLEKVRREKAFKIRKR